MELNEIMSLINGVGFPIVACVFMYMQVQKMNNIILELTTTLKGIDTRLDSLQEQLNKESDKKWLLKN